MKKIKGVTLYRDFDDWWVGYYRGPQHHYVCLLPTFVIRWRNRRTRDALSNIAGPASWNERWMDEG